MADDAYPAKIAERKFALHVHATVDVRGVGLLWGIELVDEGGDPLPGEETAQVVSYVKNEGVLIGKSSGIAEGPSNTLTIAPPLILTEEQAARVATAIEVGLTKFQAGG